MTRQVILEQSQDPMVSGRDLNDVEWDLADPEGNFVAYDPTENGSRVIAVFENRGATEVKVVLETGQPCNYGTPHFSDGSADIPIPVPPGALRVVGPLIATRFPDSMRRVNFSYEGDVSGLCVKAFKLPKNA